MHITFLEYVIGICDTYVSIWQYIDTFFMYHDTILCYKDIDMTHVMLILNYVCYEVNADGSKDNGAGKEVELKNLKCILNVSGTKS